MNLAVALQKAISACAQPYYQHQRRLERESRAPQDYSYLQCPARVTLEERLFRLFPEGYRLASDNAAFTPMVRQLYYVMRRLLQEDGCQEDLSDKYHRTVLEKYEIQLGKRLCYRKAVGDMIEPHSHCPTCGKPQGCNLGTEDVEGYVVTPHRFNKVLYVEKTGFMQQLLAANIHNRFDVAIAAGAGFSPQAAKELFAKIERAIPITVYVLHDADIAGLEIARTLGDKLVHEDYRIEVVDLGLRPAEAISLGLPSETVEITAKPSEALMRSVSPEELHWLLGKEEATGSQHWKKNRKVRYVGIRAELNAFTPRQFIAWVEEKLQGLPGKIVPDVAVLKQAVDQHYRATVKQEVLAALVARFDLRAFLASLPAYTGLSAEQIHARLAAAPEQNWQGVIAAEVEKEVQRLGIAQRIQASHRERC